MPDDLESLKGELERERRSLAMLPPSAYVTKDKAMELIRQCQAAIAAAQGPERSLTHRCESHMSAAPADM
jgi:hypothetical protein